MQFKFRHKAAATDLTRSVTKEAPLTFAPWVLKRTPLGNGVWMPTFVVGLLVLIPISIYLRLPFEIHGDLATYVGQVNRARACNCIPESGRDPLWSILVWSFSQLPVSPRFFPAFAVILILLLLVLFALLLTNQILKSSPFRSRWSATALVLGVFLANPFFVNAATVTFRATLCLVLFLIAIELLLRAKYAIAAALVLAAFLTHSFVSVIMLIALLGAFLRVFHIFVLLVSGALMNLLDPPVVNQVLALLQQSLAPDIQESTGVDLSQLAGNALKFQLFTFISVMCVGSISFVIFRRELRQERESWLRVAWMSLVPLMIAGSHTLYPDRLAYPTWVLLSVPVALLALASLKVRQPQWLFVGRQGFDRASVRPITRMGIAAYK